MAFIEAQDVVKDYSGHRALDGLSLSVPEGHVYGLLGPNGAGKTTFIRILNQITRPDSGEVLLEGRPLCPADVERIGYLPEERGLYKKMKVGEEAVYLAERILILSNKPTTIKEDLKVDLPRPRDVTSPDFIRIRQYVTDQIKWW